MHEARPPMCRKLVLFASLKQDTKIAQPLGLLLVWCCLAACGAAAPPEPNLVNTTAESQGSSASSVKTPYSVLSWGPPPEAKTSAKPEVPTSANAAGSSSSSNETSKVSVGCCLALQQMAASAPMGTKGNYMMAAAACFAASKRQDVTMSTLLGPLLTGANLPAICRQ